MPLVPDYSFTNVAPEPKELPGYALTENAPGVRALDFALTENAPGAKALDFGLTANPPEAKALDFTLTGDAPGAKVLDFALTEAAPGAKAVDFAQTADAPGVKALDFAQTNDAPDAVSPGSFEATNQPPLFMILPGLLEAPTDNTVNTPTLQISGELAADGVYGHTRITVASALTRVQVQLNDCPTGGPATLQLIDGAGQAIGGFITVLAGQFFGELVLAANAYIGLAANLDVRLKCITPGATIKGGFGAATLYLQQVQA